MSDDPILRRTTLAALSQHLKDQSRVGVTWRLGFLKDAVALLEHRLDLHKAGAKSCKAADVYNTALFVAALALLLAERGTAGYPYATGETTGQLPLNLK
jgi:hypothetical protein